MTYRISILLAAVCFCGGCFSSHEGAPHPPAIAVSAVTDFNGVYSNQSIDAEMVGRYRRLGLFERILFDVRPHPFDAADSASKHNEGSGLAIQHVALRGRPA